MATQLPHAPASHSSSIPSSEAFEELWKVVFAPQWPVRVSNLTGMGLVAMMVCFDGVQMVLPLFHVIPLAGTAIGFLGPFILGITGTIILIMAFSLCEVRFLDGKKAMAKIGAMLGPAAFEMVPFLSSAPMLTLGAVHTFVISRIEDRDRHEEKIREQFRSVQERESAVERTRALNAQAAVIQARQAQNLEQVSSVDSQETVRDETLGQGEAGPMPNTLIIKKRRLPHHILSHTLPTEPPIEPSAQKTTAGQGWN